MCPECRAISRANRPGTATPSVPGTEPRNTAPIQQPGFQTRSYSVQDQNSTLGNGQGVQLDLASAASNLGTTAQQLSDALEVGNTTQGLSGNLTQVTQQREATAQQLSGRDRRRECNTGPLREPHRSSTKPECHATTAPHCAGYPVGRTKNCLTRPGVELKQDLPGCRFGREDRVS